MRHVLHQFLWQVRRRRLLLSIHAALWFILTWLVWALPGTTWTEDLYFHEHAVLLGLTALLALETAGADPARGTDSFWRTRPPRWRPVCLAQVLFVIVALAGPAMVCWLVNGLMLDQTIAQWRAGLAEPVGIVSALLVLTGLRSVARGWTATVVALGVAGGFISAGTALLDYTDSSFMNALTGVNLRFSYSTTASGVFFMVACTIPAAAIVGVWAAAMRGRVPRLVAICAVVWCVLGPGLVWISVRGIFVTELQITATVPGETPAAGEKLLGVLKLRGVPKDFDAATLDKFLTAIWTEAPEEISNQDRPLLSLEWPPGSRSSLWLTTQQGQRLRAGFPAATRWYSDGTGEGGGKFVLKRWAAPGPMPTRLSGTVTGQLFALATGFAVRLEEGSAAAGDGTRMRIHAVNAGSRNLRIECDIWQSRSVEQWEGQGVEGIFILHLPAAPAAILLNRTERLSFRSLRCGCSRMVLHVTMPDAELASGSRFTAEVLSGAELWHFALGEETLFEAKPKEGVVLLYPEAGR